MAQTQTLALIAGAGPGLGQALMHRAVQGGHRTIGFTRSESQAQVGNQQVGRSSVGSRVLQLDLADPQAVSQQVKELIGLYGAPELVIHNTAQLSIAPFLESEAQTFEALWRNMVLSAFNLAQAVLPAMVQAGRGSFLVSGATASLRGSANFAAFSSAKFALRGLTQSLAREFQPKGLHIAHIILDGLIDTPASRARTGRDPARMMKPEDIAEAYWNLAHQPLSTWTQELDLRPQSETF